MAGGAIETKAELYALADGMLSQLADPYSSFLPPADFRRALRRPLPVERSYLAAQSVGEHEAASGGIMTMITQEEGSTPSSSARSQSSRISLSAELFPR